MADVVVGRARGAVGKNRRSGGVQRGVSTAAEAGHGVRRSQVRDNSSVVLWSCAGAVFFELAQIVEASSA